MISSNSRFDEYAQMLDGMENQKIDLTAILEIDEKF